MSVQRRAGFYDWLREHTDPDIAGYAMSWVASARAEEWRS